MRPRRFRLSLAFLLALFGTAIACGDRPRPASTVPLGPTPDSFRVSFETTRGTFVVEAHRAWSPNGVDRFYALTSTGAFDDNGFFRVVPGFIVQFGANGDPKVNAHWDSLHIADDTRITKNLRGTIAFAKEGKDSRTHQVFINLADNAHLDRDAFVPFGRVVEGMGVVDSIYAGYREKPEYHLIATMGNAYLHRMFRSWTTSRRRPSSNENAAVVRSDSCRHIDDVSLRQEIVVNRRMLVLVLSGLLPTTLLAQVPSVADATHTGSSAQAKEPNVEFEMMTWPEVKQAMAEGKTTALFYTGGTEQRGPQNVNGGHTLMAKATVKAIALKLGNAIAMPVLPYTVNNASAALPGTIGLTPEIQQAILERIAEEAIKTGFKNVIIMGDHGGGQPATYRNAAAKLDSIYAPKGIHVYFCDEVYAKAQGDFDKWLAANGYPVSSHAGIPDTSEMWYLGGELWVRTALIPTAVGDTTPRGAQRDPNAPRVNNGISGDARRSSIALGKKAFDNKVDYAVRQIRELVR